MSAADPVPGLWLLTAVFALAVLVLLGLLRFSRVHEWLRESKDPIQAFTSFIKGPSDLCCGAQVLAYRFQSTKQPELLFHALLRGGAREVRFERVAAD